MLFFRTFSRAVVIPFSKVKKGKDSLQNCFNLQKELKAVLPRLMMSVGVVLEMATDFLEIQRDPLFQEVTQTIEQIENLDMRTQCNYALLLYSMGKVPFIQNRII